MEQEDGSRKKIGFEIIRKVDKGTQHTWHSLLRKAILCDQEEAESNEVHGANRAVEGNEDKEHPKGETCSKCNRESDKVNKVRQSSEKDLVWSKKDEEREREGGNERVKVGF